MAVPQAGKGTMRLRRLLVVVAATATVAVISLGPVPASVGALVDPATPSVSNIPAGPVYGTSFVSTVSTNSDGSPFVTSGTPSICTVGGDGMTVSLVGVGSCTLIAHTPATATFNAADGNAQTFGVAPAVPSAPTITNVPGNATVGNGFLATVSTDGDGPTSVQSNSTGICTVGGDGLT